MASGKVLVDDVELYYEKKGDGPHIIACIPGAMGDTNAFSKQLEYFGSRQEFTVVTFDPRGYGKSRPPQRQFTKEFLTVDVKDVIGLMDALGYKQFSVFGSSNGAMIAMILASLFPDTVHKLVIWEVRHSWGKRMQKYTLLTKKLQHLIQAHKLTLEKCMVKNWQLAIGDNGATYTSRYMKMVVTSVEIILVI